MDLQTDMCTGRQTDRQIDRQTDRQTILQQTANFLSWYDGRSIAYACVELARDIICCILLSVARLAITSAAGSGVIGCILLIEARLAITSAAGSGFHRLQSAY